MIKLFGRLERKQQEETDSYALNLQEVSDEIFDIEPTIYDQDSVRIEADFEAALDEVTSNNIWLDQLKEPEEGPATQQLPVIKVEPEVVEHAELEWKPAKGYLYNKMKTYENGRRCERCKVPTTCEGLCIPCIIEVGE